MRKEFFLFELDVPEKIEDIPPLFGETVSDIEKHLEEQGIEIVEMKRVKCEENKLYRGSLFGIGYRFGFFVADDELHFLFTIPLAVKLAEERYSRAVWEKLETRLNKGYAERVFYRLGGFQFAELVDSKLYVGTEW